MSHVIHWGSLGCLSFLALLGACTNDTVSLGGGQLVAGVPPDARCGGSPIVQGTVRVTQQSELDDLAGCTAIDGDLQVEVFTGADLRPLASLRTVGGTLELGAYPQLPDGVFDSDSYAALNEKVDASVAAGYLTSLDGLENLQQVANLWIDYIAAESLAPLALHALVGGQGSSPGGTLAIYQTANLRDLRGLENVANIRDLSLSDNLALSSLGGIQLGSALDNIDLVDSPSLTSIEELSGVGSVSEITLSNLGITDLASLGGLGPGSSIAITGNRNLSNIDAIANLDATSLLINDNAVLQSIPAFPRMSFLESFRAVDNPELQTISIDLPGHYSGPDTLEGETLIDPIKLFDIGRNAKLTSISLAAGLAQGRLLDIYDNPALVSVALGTLSALEKLSVHNNPNLSSVDLGTLRTVGTLWVMDNPNLDTNHLGGLQTFEKRLVGNGYDPAP